MKRTFTLFTVLLLGSLASLHAADRPASGSIPTNLPVKNVRLILPAQSGPVAKNIGKVFVRQVQQRCEAKVMTDGDAPFTVELAIAPGNGAEGFGIEDRPGGVRIVGNDERGLLYGVGKLLRTSRYDQGGFTPSIWREISVPHKPVRGIYFATHFYNYYHAAPTEEIERYVEDLGLWGYNALVVWYDMHHFDGADDPQAVAFREHLHKILAAARRIGLDVGLGVIANEAYGNSPPTLRADPSAQRGGWYDCAVCPNKPGGMEYILDVLGGEFDWAADLSPRYVWIWPYDQGGCGCTQCRPWGSNGFLKAAERVAALARRKLPGTEIILSTWFLNEGEWQGLHKAFAEKKPFADYVLAEGTARPMPAKLPMVGFPEISMHNTFPWGGFGATPLPRRAEQQWNAVKHTSSGGFPYSEGIFEDITKAAIGQLYWSDRPTSESVREYIAFEFAPEVADEIAGVVATLEKNHHWRWWPDELKGVKLDLNWFPSRGAKPQADPGAEEAYATIQRVDAKLTPQARQSWRWRQLYLRALLDAELKANGGSPNARCNKAFAELIKIYHAEKANPAVRPPLPGGAQ
ncbi:MAG: hypothetical protein NTY19_20410 [Planctomycetota bacterium]|nr:hypothetical protein [Planctomycetota bacterium]